MGPPLVKRAPIMQRGKAMSRLDKLLIGGCELFKGVNIKVASGMANRATKTLGKRFYCRSVEDGVKIYREE